MSVCPIGFVVCRPTVNRHGSFLSPIPVLHLQGLRLPQLLVAGVFYGTPPSDPGNAPGVMEHDCRNLANCNQVAWSAKLLTMVRPSTELSECIL